MMILSLCRERRGNGGIVAVLNLHFIFRKWFWMRWQGDKAIAGWQCDRSNSSLVKAIASWQCDRSRNSSDVITIALIWAGKISNYCPLDGSSFNSIYRIWWPQLAQKRSLGLIDAPHWLQNWRVGTGVAAFAAPAETAPIRISISPILIAIGFKFICMVPIVIGCMGFIGSMGCMEAGIFVCCVDSCLAVPRGGAVANISILLPWIWMNWFPLAVCSLTTTPSKVR